MYKLFNSKDELIQESYDRSELWDLYKNEILHKDWYILEVIPCRGCGNDGEEQHDAYGISTGYWCDSCYNSNKYPYRKDRYDTIEHHGRGERLNDDY